MVFNEGLCKVIEQYVKKGSKVYLEGQLQTRKWQDNEGKDRWSTEVVLQGFNSNLTMLDGRGDNQGGGGFSDQSGGGSFGQSGPSGGGSFGGPSDGGIDDEIPF